MASPSVTYTFSNSTTADASQVNQNFTDLINGASDGTKDYSINALTCAGNVTLNGTTNTIGNASGDDLVITASLASSIAIKTTATYNIGAATLGILSTYYGNSTFTTRLIANTLTASGTLTMPAITGTIALTLDSSNSREITNASLTATVGSNALTIALKSNAGTDASATDPVYIAFRSATVTSGVYVRRSVTAALSVVVSSGSTLGTANAVAADIYVYAIDNAGTVELAVSRSKFDEGSVQTTTAEGAGGAADSAAVLYSTTQRTSVPVRLIGRLTSTQTTAGTWASAISVISLPPFDMSDVSMSATGTPPTGTLNGSYNDVIFGTATFDTHGKYDTTTGIYTVPVAGKYHVSANILVVGTYALNSNLQLALSKNNSATSSALGYVRSGGAETIQGVAVNCTVSCVAGDTLRVKSLTDATSLSFSSTAGANTLSIHRISA